MWSWPPTLFGLRPRPCTLPSMKWLLSLIALSSLLACGEGTDLHLAETENSPESYEAFLEQYPDSAHAAELQVKIEELRFERAMESRNPETLRDYLERHPDSDNVARAAKLEDQVSWQVADAAKTAEAYKSYLDLHPDGKWTTEAGRAHAKYEYVANMTVSEPVSQRVNMAQDPAGPLNGWGVQADVTNTGDQRLRTVKMAIDFLGAEGNVVRIDKWYTVVQDLGPLPVQPHLLPIMEPGETRTFRWTTKETPAGWDEGKFAVRVTFVKVEKEPEPEPEP